MSRRAVPSQGRHTRWWLLALALLVAALAVFAAGCGGDDDDEAGGTDTAASTGEGTETGAAEGSIWVLLPDSASSDRWEKDDRRFFEEAFEDAGRRVQHRQRRGRREHPAAAGRAGDQRRREGDPARQPELRVRRDDHRDGPRGGREGRRLRPADRRRRRRGRLRQLRQRQGRPDDGRHRRPGDRRARRRHAEGRDDERRPDGQQLEALQAGLQRDGRLRRLEEGRRRRVGGRRRPGRARLGQPAGADPVRADPRRADDNDVDAVFAANDGIAGVGHLGAPVGERRPDPASPARTRRRAGSRTSSPAGRR